MMSPRTISPWRRGKTWWARVPQMAGDAVQRSLGTSDHQTAVQMCRFLEWLRAKRESWLLGQLGDGTCPVGEAYDAWHENRFDAFVAQLRDGQADVDLEPLVLAWQKELKRVKRPNAETALKYLTQVRTLVVEGKPFPRSQFTKQRVRDWLDGLKIAQPNRYRAALSSFAEFLIFEEVIADNPVRRVKMARESDPRTKHLTPRDVTLLLAAFADDQMRALHGLMLTTGMEFGAAQRVNPETATTTSVFAAGSKTVHRQRTCTIYDRWAGHWASVYTYLQGHEKPFAGVSVWQSGRALAAALKVAGLDTTYRQHDHRHTWAVQAIRDGLAPQTIAYQLGHRDAHMLSKVYGRYRPQDSDFGLKKASSATPTATSAPTTGSSPNAK